MASVLRREVTGKSLFTGVLLGSGTEKFRDFQPLKKAGRAGGRGESVRRKVVYGVWSLKEREGKSQVCVRDFSFLPLPRGILHSVQGRCLP